MLTILLAILAALTAARRMVSRLFPGFQTATQEVAAGDFGRAVEAGDRDEIGFLVHSFNEMIQALKAASQAAEDSRAETPGPG